MIPAMALSVSLVPIYVAIIAAIGATVGLGIAKFGTDQFNAALSSFPGGPPFWFTIGMATARLFAPVL